MAVDGAIKEKKKIKEDEAGATAEDGGTKNKSKYLHASVQTMIKTEQSCLKISEEEQREYDAPEKRKKKKKKEKANDVSELCCDASVQTAVKTERLEIDVPQKEKKKKKKIIKESEPLQENAIKISEDEEKIDEECLVKKKKKKKKETKVVEEEEIDVGHKKKKKKRKNMEDEEQNPELEDGEVKKTRTKTEANVKDERAEKQTERKKKTTTKEKNTDLTENTETLVKVDKEKKVKTKKEKLAPIEEEMNVNTEKKSKKKKKRRLENLDEGQRTQDDRTNAKTGDVIGKMMSSKHKKIKNIKLEVDDVTEMEELHDKNKSREKSDVVFLSAKSGNQDEVSIDQARRLALQREIDKESQPEPNLGQWSTAQFDSSDRQTKFMRLMGGFKKSSQPITGSSGQANMALGKEAQQTLQQGLLGEFESAQSRHLDFRNKGIGLGFTPPSNKKFAIDVNARNSMRFDD